MAGRVTFVESCFNTIRRIIYCTGGVIVLTGVELAWKSPDIAFDHGRGAEILEFSCIKLYGTLFVNKIPILSSGSFSLEAYLYADTGTAIAQTCCIDKRSISLSQIHHLISHHKRSLHHPSTTYYSSLDMPAFL